MTKLPIGQPVERIAKDYTGGRKGRVVDAKDGRAKVHWTLTKDGKPINRNTWVSNADLKLLQPTDHKAQTI